jgi:hypothetical protein
MKLAGSVAVIVCIICTVLIIVAFRKRSVWIPVIRKFVSTRNVTFHRFVGEDQSKVTACNGFIRFSYISNDSVTDDSLLPVLKEPDTDRPAGLRNIFQGNVDDQRLL